MATTTRRRIRRKQPPMSLWGMIKKMIGDSIQSESGNVDPARWVGYLFTSTCGGVFIWGVIYDTLQNHHFNGIAFAAGAAGLAGLMVGAAGGVKVKNDTELPLSQQGGTPPNPPPFVPGAGGPDGPAS